jgi:hypothetical protein
MLNVCVKGLILQLDLGFGLNILVFVLTCLIALNVALL